MRGELHFDFTGLDPEAPNLDLIVVPTEEHEIAIRQVAGEIAGAVHARIGAAGGTGERIGQETFGGEFRAIEIAACDANTANVKFADRTHRHRRLIVIEQIDPGIGDRLADRHGLRIEIRGARKSGHVDGGFGGTVKIVQLRLRQALQTAPRGRNR
nr:hypothetical protein [Burkholderia stagnalis]